MRCWLTLLALLIGCGSNNPCMEYCKRLDAWYDDCGTTWETEHPEAELSSVEDCYDHYWEAQPRQLRACEQRTRELTSQECY